MAAVVRLRFGRLSFAWDPVKAEDNIRKHAIAFEEAATTWLDPLAIERFDEEHSAAEDRWFRIGSSLRGAMLVVWSTERESEREVTIRIIGARRATRRERRLYENKRKTP